MIYFIGAGPGYGELITVKGRKIIEKADIVLYAGSSVSGELLSLAKSDAIIIDSTSTTFREQIEIMDSNQDKIVCRLHQGCLGVFSTMKEYTDVLDAKDITYECISGISVIDYICAKLHLETCLQGVSQGLIICRSDSVNVYLPKRRNQNIRSFAGHQTSMIVFMAESELSYTAKEMLKGGFKKDTPCVLFGNAAYPDEWFLKFTLDELTKERNLPSGMFIMLVGDFIRAVSSDVSNYSTKELELPRIFED